MATAANRLEKDGQILERGRSLLLAYSPYNVLEKGYAIIRNEQDEVVASVQGLDAAQSFRIRVKDGEAAFEKGVKLNGTQ